MAAVIFENLAIIGAGLIGSSIAHSARAAGIVRHIRIFDQSSAVRARVQELGYADTVPETIGETVSNADLIMLCVPVGAMGAVAASMAAFLKQGALVSDVGSVKASVVKAVKPHLPEHVGFIPGHPVAGTEESGPDAGFNGLFENRWCILTPLENANAAQLEKLTRFWQEMGANTECMTPKHHDLVLSITSHLPHLIAYNIVGTAADMEEVTQSEIIKFSAGGFRDFTRIASSDPIMWRDIFINNKEAVLETLGRFTEDLIALQRAIRWEQAETLQRTFTRTRAIRRSIVETGQDAPDTDFGRVKNKKRTVEFP